jgi:DNA polymerase-3 subunit gamma/tau
MSFLSLYRKYRPENFNDLIGQDQVKQTLKNALKNDRVAHAYLFAGPRGTGKTSAAKVFAKSLNCANPTADFEPCGECNSCQRIEKGNSLDVIEIDAASNRGIDEIRELREKVKFYPGEGKYKVYIIDEVHMLTKGAFNALLKTLEEPPESVVFILATTEPHEVITTIMSRCQRFDFTLLTLTNLKKRLKYISDSEGYEIDREALDILARSARGGMRDAISLLDQAISFSDGQLSAEEVTRMLGRINKSDLKQFLIYLSKKESQQALGLLNKQLEAGLGIERFSDELIEYCRELLLIKECGIDSGILEYSRSYLEEIASVAANLSTKEITNIIDEFASLKEKLRSSARPRLQLEICVIKLSSRESSSSLETRLSELEFKLENILNSRDDSGFKNELNLKKPEAAANSNQDKQSKIKEEKIESTNEKVENKDKKDIKPAKPEKPAKTTNNAGVSLKYVKEHWAKILNEIRQLDVSVQALLREGEPTAVDNKTVIVSFPESKKFHYKGTVSNKALISRVLRNVLNEGVELEIQLGAKKKDLTEKTNEKLDKKHKDDLDLVEEKSSEKTREIDNQSQDDNKQKNMTDGVHTAKNDLQTKTPASQIDKKNNELAGDLDIENLARIFSGEIIEVDQSILENRGGN